MDPIIDEIAALAKVGVIVRRTDDLLMELYEAPGYPELTRNQVRSLAAQLAPHAQRTGSWI